MLKVVKYIWSRRVIIYIVLIMLGCPLSMVLGTFTPENLGFLEPVVCPSGMHLYQVTEVQDGPEGTEVALDVVCTDGEQKVGATGRMALFVCGGPILVGVLLVLPAFFSPSKKRKRSADAEE